MADMPALTIALLTVAGGGTVLATQGAGFPPRPAIAEQAQFAPVDGAAPVTARPVRGGRKPIVIHSRDDGLYYVDATVNGATVHFLIDTGSNMVVLSPQDAARAGVAAGSPGALNTAAGQTSSAMGRIDSIVVAGRELHDVGTAIPASDLGVSLLGQNVLSELGEVRINRSTLTFG